MNEFIGIAGLVLGLLVLIVMIFKMIHPIFAALAATLVVAVFNSVEPWTALTNLFSGIGATFGTYLSLFFLATIYGKLMSDTYCANSIAAFFIRLFGNKSVVLIVSVTTALLVYGGVSAMVVAFTVFPIGVSLIRKANISNRLLPAMIQLGQATFALTALPGTPQLNNIIPCSYLGTTSTAAPGLGLIASVIMFGLGYLYLQHEVKLSTARGETFDESMLRDVNLACVDADKAPAPLFAFLPIIILIVLYVTFENVSFGTYKLGEFNEYAPVCTAMLIAILYLIILGVVRKEKDHVIASIKDGSVSWISPLLNFAIVVGFGSVIKNTIGYAALLDIVTGFDMNPYISAALSVTALAGVTGSASGGIKIALSSEQLIESWTRQISAPNQLAALHRIVSVASCGLDSLPHCGGILATLEICHETHARAYKYIFVITVICPLIATFAIAALASMGITF